MLKTHIIEAFKDNTSSKNFAYEYIAEQGSCATLRPFQSGTVNGKNLPFCLYGKFQTGNPGEKW